MLETAVVKATKALSEWIVAEVDRRGWSQAELSRRCGWPNQSKLSKLLKGDQRFMLDDLERVARGFDLPLATMLSLALGDQLDDAQRKAVSDAATISLGDYGVDGARIIAALLRQVEDYQRQLETLQPSDAGKRSAT